MSDQSIDAALILHLKAWPDLAAIVGERVYPDFIPQGRTDGEENLPAVAVSVDSEEHEESLDRPPLLVQGEFEVSGFAETKLEAERIRSAVRSAIAGFIGTMGEYTNVKIEGLGSTRSVFVSPGQRERRVWRTTISGTIWYYEPQDHELNSLTA